MIATNTIAPISHSLKMLVQRIREEVRVRAEFQGDRGHDRADQDVISSIEKTLDRADAELAALSGEEGNIQADADTSDQGKVKRMMAAVARAYESLKSVRKDATRKRDAAKDAETSLATVPKGETDATLDALTGIEIRRVLRTMVQPDRLTLFAQSVQQKNVAVQRAVLNDPFFGFPAKPLEPLVPQDYIDRVRDEHAQATRGAEWRRWQTLVFGAERLEILAGAIEASLGTYGQQIQSFDGKPVRTSDLHQVNPQRPPDKSSSADQPTRESFQ